MSSHDTSLPDDDTLLTDVTRSDREAMCEYWIQVDSAAAVELGVIESGERLYSTESGVTFQCPEGSEIHTVSLSACDPDQPYTYPCEATVGEWRDCIAADANAFCTRSIPSECDFQFPDCAE